MSRSAREDHLVLQAQAGDRSAQDELLQRLQAPLYGYLKGLCGDAHMAEDLLQDVFVITLRKLRWLRRVELVRPWVYRIASREAFRALKRRRPVQPIEAAHDQPAQEQDAAALEPEERDRLLARVAELSPASRAVVLLHYLQGLSLEDVARVLGIAVGTVKSRLAYGLATLRQQHLQTP
ncbi:MAG: RNA polymerase sigma factor [Planctomycetota bacterium]|nr:RNA polymerase sigma factor [Planctomycetota bacterium]